MTHSPTPTPGAARRLEAVARAACAGGAESILDVGCGNGLLVPFLGEEVSYRGIDVSARMIDAAEAAYGRSGARFECVNFDAAADGSEAEQYDAILFNGSLQFFADAETTLARAAAILRPGAQSRLVIAHIGGAEFVRREMIENPSTVQTRMPSLDRMQQLATELGLEVAPWDGVSWETLGAEADRLLDDFYLVALRRPVRFEIEGAE